MIEKLLHGLKKVNSNVAAIRNNKVGYGYRKYTRPIKSSLDVRLSLGVNTSYQILLNLFRK